MDGETWPLASHKPHLLVFQSIKTRIPTNLFLYFDASLLSISIGFAEFSPSILYSFSEPPRVFY